MDEYLPTSPFISTFVVHHTPFISVAYFRS
ncbi:MAG: hypothetical protein A4E29_00170 [Methanomassiliicoccales archaeon PtaB.Bin134]|nr:MAG: hypothetical protein A4E29_00170 [Methanomassiliicoccales archaeon PtaB.Bin134]